MSGYRFCRTDDITLLVDALNRCWQPHFPGEPPVTAASFKRSIRDLQVWCSSCMVAFAGADPIGVLIGAKRASGTLVHRIAVHPDHLRQGHGRHLLTSLSSKLSILGPPRLVAEVPEGLAAARALFTACGYVEDAVLTDYVWTGEKEPDPGLTPFLSGEKGVRPGSGSFFVLPTTVDDLVANKLTGSLDTGPWGRCLATLAARKDEIAGVAAASDEGLEAYILYMKNTQELLAIRSFVEDGGIRLRRLLSWRDACDGEPLRLAKVHPAEMPAGLLERLGFRPAGRHFLYTATARSA